MIGEAGIEAIANKSKIGTEMMIGLYDHWLKDLGFTLLTPRNYLHRGGHITLGHPDAKKIAVALRKFKDVIPDFRAPSSIRLAISPLPTSFQEIWIGFERLKELVISGKYKEVDLEGLVVT